MDQRLRLSQLPKVLLQPANLLFLQELSVPLTRFLKAFPAPTALHPFEAALLDLTVGTATYSSVLGKVGSLRKALQEVRAS
jgi:GTP1/Obg family GTP-binding protein